MARKKTKAPVKPGTCRKVKMGSSGMRWLCRCTNGRVQISSSNNPSCAKKRRKKSKR